MGKLQQLKQMKQSINIITNPSEIIVGIVDPNDEVNVVIEPVSITDDVIEHVWKTMPGGKQIMIRSGDSGALSGNDMRKIDISIADATKNPANVTVIRENLVTKYIPDSERHLWQERYLLDGTDGWISSPASIGASNMCIANNVTKGRSRYEGLSKRQMLQIKRNEEVREKYPKDNMLKAVNVQLAFNRGMAKEKFGKEPFTVYRGIYGDQAAGIKAKAKKGDTIRIDSNTLSSWTTNREMARNFSSKEKTGVVIKSKVSYKNVFDSYASTSRLTSKQFPVDEVIVSPRGMKITGVVM